MNTGLSNSLSSLIQGHLQWTSHFIISCLSFPLRKPEVSSNRGAPKYLHANQPNGQVNFSHWVSMLQKPCTGDVFPQTGLEHQVQVSELLLQSFVLLLGICTGGPAHSIKTTLYMGILLSLACGDTEQMLCKVWKSIYIPNPVCF